MRVWLDVWVWTLWLVIGLLVGFIAMAILNTHGGFVTIPLSLFVAFPGAAAVSCLYRTRLVLQPLAARVAAVTLAASSVILFFAVFGVISKESYTAVTALGFATPFVVGAAVVSLLTDFLFSRTFRERSQHAT
jgi:uncharacterized membrane protein YeaQ/YmgE (transglycosylase-associated protein family)